MHIYAALGGDGLAYCGLTRPHADRSGSTLAQVMAYCVTAPKPLYNSMWTSDLVRLCGIYLGVMSQRGSKVCTVSFKINSKLLQQVPESNEFKKD